MTPKVSRRRISAWVGLRRRTVAPTSRSCGTADQSDSSARRIEEHPPEDWQRSQRERYRNLSLTERDAQDRRIAATVRRPAQERTSLMEISCQTG
jgi:hypothetical protein